MQEAFFPPCLDRRCIYNLENSFHLQPPAANADKEGAPIPPSSAINTKLRDAFVIMASKNVTTGTTSARAWGSQAAVNLSVSEKRRVIIHGLPWAKNQDVAKSQIDLLLASLELDKAW